LNREGFSEIFAGLDFLSKFEMLVEVNQRIQIVNKASKSGAIYQ